MNSRAPLYLAVLMVMANPVLAADAPSSPAAPRADAGKFAAVSQRMTEFVDKHEVAGAVTLVVSKDKVVDVQAVGEADLASHRPMTPDAIFWIASMTKPITATAVLMLQDEGKLSVDDPVSKYVPELAGLKTPSGKPANLSLRHLLTHTSGMAEASGEQARAAKALADLIPAYAAKPTQFEPGSKWQYCQSGINTLGRIVEVVSGQSLPDFFDKRLFEPLGMKDTTFYPSADQVKRLATSYKRTDDGKLEPATISILAGHEPSARDRYPAANGGLFSTAADYGRFCRMLLNDGALDGKTYLKPETVKLMRTISSGDLQTGFTPGNGWGLGVCVVRQPQGTTAGLSPGTFGHGGAYGTQAWIDPEKGVAYVLMVQRANFKNSDDSEVRKAFQAAAVEAIGR